MEKLKVYSHTIKKHGYVIKNDYDNLNKKNQQSNILVYFKDRDRLMSLSDIRICYELDSKFFDSSLSTLEVITTICRNMNIDFSNVYKSGRKKEIVKIRHYIHFFLRKFARSYMCYKIAEENKQITYNEIISITGCVSHATVIHSVRTLKNWYATDCMIRMEIDFLNNELKKLNYKKNEA